MSLCHPDREGSPPKVSCGACCGLFNLKLDSSGYKRLLKERTDEFRSTVNLSVRHTFPAFRQHREAVEQGFSKNDDMTYNCPFLGYVDEKEARIGCMIHPIFTGDPKSQNFSFYGTSICQAYDCKNKEHELVDLWEKIFLDVTEDSVQFSHLASDHILCFVLERFLVLKGWSVSEGLASFEGLFASIFRIRLGLVGKVFPTSFEIRYESFPDLESVYSFLREYLGEGISDLWQEIKNTPERV